MARQITPFQEHPFIELGRLISEESFSREKKEIRIDNIAIDLIQKPDGQVVVGEIKKSSKFMDSARMQLAFYLMKLRENGVSAKGELVFPKEKKREEVKLTPEIESQLHNACLEIEKIIEQELPPPLTKIGYCKNCGYKEMCWT